MLLRSLLMRLYRLPERSLHVAPADLGLEARDVELASVDGGRLRGWFLPAAGAAAEGPRPVVIVLHGWASAAEDLLPAAPAVVGAGLPMLFVDARGHGRSDPAEFMSMPRFAEDLHAALDWLRGQPDVDPDRIAVVGHSVGAGAALLVASRDPRVAAVVSIASMAHPREMIGRSFRRYRAPRPLVRAALRTIERTIGHRFDDFAPLQTIARIDAPVLVLHGLDDRTVPAGDAERLAAAGPAATLRLVPGADHRSVDGFLPVLPEVVAHLRDAFSRPPADHDA
jgi:dipeptidyl aminopeptidase/acylaminoacyl peptidase